MEDGKFEQELKDIMRSAVPKNTQEASPTERPISVQGNANYVAGGHIIFAPSKDAPSELPAESSQTCPQCGDLNWVTKRHCKTCDLNLFAYAAFHYHGGVIKRLWYSAAGIVAVGLVALFIASPVFKRFGLETASMVASLVGLGCMGLLLMTTKEIERHSIVRRNL